MPPADPKGSGPLAGAAAVRTSSGTSSRKRRTSGFIRGATTTTMFAGLLWHIASRASASASASQSRRRLPLLLPGGRLLHHAPAFTIPVVRPLRRQRPLLRDKHHLATASRRRPPRPPRTAAAAAAAAGDGAEAEAEPSPFASSYHAPVMWREVLEWLVIDPQGGYLDCTLGGGGHSAAILSRLDPTGAGRVVALDQDPDALAFATKRLAAAVGEGRFRAVRANFRSALASLEAEGCVPPGGFTGMLLDLGVSSHQLDEASRGFSFRGDGPLDMRMQGGTGGGGDAASLPPAAAAARGGLTAADIVNTWEVGALTKVLREYGEEPRAYKLARAMIAARPVETTAALREVVERHTAYGDRPKTLARVFQGLRIAVNGEMEALSSVLTQATSLVRPGGRLVVLSYHSLEDRPVKRFMRSGTLDGEVRRDFYGHALRTWRPLTRASLRPTEAEVAANARARSVSMRVAERTELTPEEVDAKVGAPPPA